jgi:hypothetical protein
MISEVYVSAVLAFTVVKVWIWCPSATEIGFPVDVGQTYGRTRTLLASPGITLSLVMIMEQSFSERLPWQMNQKED